MANNRENVSIFWDSPLNSDGTLYSHIKSYELHHNIPGYPSPLTVPANVTSGGPLPLPPGKYHIAVSAINTEGHKSAKVMTKFEVAKPLINPNAKRGYGIPLGGIISSATTISSAGIFNVTNTSGWAFASEGAPQIFSSYLTGQTARFEQDCSDIQSLTFSSMSPMEQAIKSHYLFYDYSDANDPWKLLKWQDTVYATNNINIAYFWDTGTGDDGTDTWAEHVARAFASKSGTVTLAIGSNEVVGSGTSFSSEYKIGDIILFAGDTQAGVVTYVDTDLSLTIDRTFTTAISGSIKRQEVRIDKNYDSAVYIIRKDAGTFKKLAMNLTVDTDVFTGQGVRQVNLYKLNDASLTSTTAGTFADPGAGNTDWSQAVPAITANNDRVYVASRTFTSDAASPQDAAWSSPVVYSERTDGEAGADGAAGIAGADGDDGAGIEYIFARTADSSTTPSTPNNNWGFDQPSSPWFDGAPSLSTSNKALWRAHRAILGNPSVGDSVSDSWSSSTVVGRFADDGVAGADGDDGAGIEYIFAVTSDSGTVPSSPNNSWGFDQPSSPWFDGAPSMTASNKALWRAQRNVAGTPSVGDSVSDNWTSPSVVGRFAVDGATGLQGVAGAAGDDGAGIEYIFAKTADTSTSPSAPNNAWGFDNPSSPWSDAAPSLDTSNKALWRAQRAILGNPSVGDSVSDTWSSSTVVGRFADDGVAGAAGDDGAGIEYIFAVTSDSDTSPSTPNNSWGFDQPSAPWYDAAPAMTTSNKALWRAQRAILGNPSVGASVSANWSSSSVVGRFADDGDDGDDGAPGPQGPQGTQGPQGPTGDDGEPLRNAQVYFFHNAYQSSAPTAPTTSEVAYNFSTQTPTITTSGWSANLSPPALSSDDTGNNKLHAVKVVFQETTYNGAYTETISNVFTWTAFDGLVTFTNLNNATNENGVASATLIDGGGIIAGSIEVDRLSAGSGTISTGREFHLGSGAAIGTADVVMFGKGTSTDMSGVAGLAGSGGIGVGGAAIGATSAGGWFGSAASSNYATTSWNTYCEMATPGKSAVFGGTVDILSGVTSITNLNLGSATNTGDKCLNLKEGAAGSRLSGQISILADSVASTGDSTLALVLDQGVEAVGTYTASHKIKVKINAVEYWLALDAV